MDRVRSDPCLAHFPEGGKIFQLEVGQPVPGRRRGLGGRHGGPGFALLGQKDRGDAIEGPGGGAHAVGAFLVIGRACGHGGGHGLPLVPVKPAHEVLFQGLDGDLRIRPHKGMGAVGGTGDHAGGIVGQLDPVGLDQAQQVLKRLPVQFDRKMAVGAADAGVEIGQGHLGERLARGVRQSCGRLVLEHGEAGRYVGLEREAA